MKKLITFSPVLYQGAMQKARILGIPFAEYLRHLILSDIYADVRSQFSKHANKNNKLEWGFDFNNKDEKSEDEEFDIME